MTTLDEGTGAASRFRKTLFAAIVYPWKAHRQPCSQRFGVDVNDVMGAEYLPRLPGVKP
jgi:hypothetical protein